MRAHSSKYAEWKAICRTLSLGYQPQLAHDAPADRFQPGMVRPARRHRGVEPDAAQRGIGGMGLGLAIAPFAAPGDGQRDRGRIAVGDAMRRHPPPPPRIAGRARDATLPSPSPVLPRPVSRAAGVLPLLLAAGG